MSEHPTANQILSQLQTHTLVQGLFLVTGERGAGKTTWLKQLISIASDSGIQVCGLLSPGTFENGVKVAINLIDLASEVERVMSTPVPQHLYAGRGGIRRLESGELVLGGWQMHEDVLNWGNNLLYQLLTAPQPANNTTQSILIIDELGPLEFNHNLGFTNAIQYGRLLNPSTHPLTPTHPDPNPPKPEQTQAYRASFIVVRPDLLPQALTIWSQAQIIEIKPYQAIQPVQA